jgi:regulatory protein
MWQKNIGTERALKKIKHYCAYQERSHAEAKEKLYSFGLYKNEVEKLLSQLIEENYLNEERYAIAFAGGKFRIKHWGRAKIKYELKQNQVSTYCINTALKLIDENDYKKTLSHLFDNKMNELRSEKNIFVKKQKVTAYLTRKGFEAELVSKLFDHE